MSKNPVCYIIGSIGQPDSQIRRDADDLLELVIRPAIEKYGFAIDRGDRRREANQIHEDVLESVRNSELCIADISNDNVNVYYEVGRRLETGKDIFFLRYKKWGDNLPDKLPVDMGTQRVIYYDLDARAGIREAKEELSQYVEVLQKRNFERRAPATLSDIAVTLSRMERKLEQMTNKPVIRYTSNPMSVSLTKQNPRDLFLWAKKNENLVLMEECLERLSVAMDKWKYIDQYVRVAASHGSEKAGNILLEHASTFVDQTELTFKQKTDFFGSLVSYLRNAKKVSENICLLEELCNRLLSDCEDISPIYTAILLNQRNRIYCGMYNTSRDIEWLNKAVVDLKKACEYAPDQATLYSNLAYCYSELPDHIQDARNAIDRAIELDKQSNKIDTDNLQTAYKIYKKLGDSHYQDILHQLREINPIKADLLE